MPDSGISDDAAYAVEIIDWLPGYGRLRLDKNYIAVDRRYRPCVIFQVPTGILIYPDARQPFLQIVQNFLGFWNCIFYGGNQMTTQKNFKSVIDTILPGITGLHPPQRVRRQKFSRPPLPFGQIYA